MPVAEATAFAPLLESFSPAAAEPAWLRSARGRALDTFQRRGLPTADDEAWRHSNPGLIGRQTFGRAGVVEATLPASLRLPDTAEIVLVNGRRSGIERPLPAGLTVCSLRELWNDDAVSGSFGRMADDVQSPFVALNSAFFEDALVIRVAPGAALSSPIHLLHVSAGEATASFPRVLVIAGAGSQATLIETFAGSNGAPYFTAPVTEIAVEDAAVFSHVRVQQEGLAGLHVASVAVRQARSSRFSSHSVALGGLLARADIDVLLAGEGADCTLNGLFLAQADGQVLDHHTRIDHARPHCTSQESYKGIVGGRARGVFVGAIVVQKAAQKTRAHQSNRNLLLSREALVQSTPQLQIYADDVQCKHGSTTGQLDLSALFYLRSRGIGEVAARELLTYAFASDVLERLPVPALRSRLAAALGSHLSGIAEAGGAA